MPPRTIVVNPETPSNTLTFTLPGGYTLDVESVLAQIDNSAGGATGAELVIADGSGQVIATKRQGDTIDAGANPATATWALRLTDEGGGSPAGSGDYVLIDEQGLSLTNNWIQFSNIPQTFRHLVMELAVCEVPEIPVLTVWINWNGGGPWSSQFTYVGSLPNGINRVANPSDGDGVYLNYGVRNGAGGAIKVYDIPSPDSGNGRAQYTVTFPYYRLPTNVRQCFWQGVVWYGLLTTQTEGAGAADFINPSPAIDTITVGPGNGSLSADSIASLYGVR